MSRYYFHTQDGRDVRDEHGTELADFAAVRRTALATMAEMSQAMSVEFWRQRSIRITVTDDRGLTLITLDLLATISSAVSGEKP